MNVPEIGPRIQRSTATPSAPRRSAGEDAVVDGRGPTVEPAEVDLRKAAAALFRPVDSPNVAWRYEAASDGCTEPTTASDGGVVVGDGKRIVKLHADGRFAWEVGHEQWTPFRPSARPDGGAVWAPDGKVLLAYDAHGQPAWTFGADDPSQQVQGVRQTVDRDGSVFVCVRSENVPYMVKLRPDGREAWRTRLAMHASAPVLADGEGGCFVKTDDDRLIRLDTDGREQWSRELPDGGAASRGRAIAPYNGRPSRAADGALWIGNDRGEVYRVASESGEPKKVFEARSQVRGAVAFDGDRAYVTSMDRTLYALDMAGKEIWHHEVGDMMEAGAVVLPGGDVLVAGATGTVRAVSPEGRERWTERVARGGSAMIVDDRGTAVIGAGRHVTAFRPGAAFENLEAHVGDVAAPTISEQDGWIVIGAVRVPRRA